ncbi:Uncharacterized protein DAT39_008622 [Clarias magur]|uniref:Uncharacterized protein n=1 Tax=Clarias magur TaxID=1594786 RepID=A0A8J4US45_CLAMG|nr:Uncharacterized protein DAT39_008622 [Clarias magur]
MVNALNKEENEIASSDYSQAVTNLISAGVLAVVALHKEWVLTHIVKLRETVQENWTSQLCSQQGNRSGHRRGKPLLTFEWAATSRAMKITGIIDSVDILPRQLLHSLSTWPLISLTPCEAALACAVGSVVVWTKMR